MSFRLSDYDYDLPPEYIAQHPAEPRDSSRLLHLNRSAGQITHRHFRDIIELVHPGDVLVLNDTRVIPARIPATKAETGGKAEILLLRQLDERTWRGLVGGRRILTGTTLQLNGNLMTAEIIEVLEGAERVIRFSEPIQADDNFQLGEIPLPPYIHEALDDSERYQTIYSKHDGSAAAPTAGLHFTGELLLQQKRNGIELAYCTLHVGLDTFKPVEADNIQEHKIHSEYASLTNENANIINQAKLGGGRVIAVGTTSARTLETAAILSAGGDPSEPEKGDDFCPWRPVIAFEDDTSLFIYPGYRWRVVDAMITNFHLPKSSLLMMMSSFVNRKTILDTYEIAKQEGYRFYSFGDAMFIE